MVDVNLATTGEVIPPLSLPELATKLNYEHKQVKECVIKGAQHAVKAGELLWEAKRKAGHGQWLEWIAENWEFSERTAQLYMKLANALLQVANPQSIADLSLTGAILVTAITAANATAHATQHSGSAVFGVGCNGERQRPDQRDASGSGKADRCSTSQ